MVFIQADVQTLMKFSFDPPVASARVQKCGSRIGLGIGTGDEQPTIAPPFALGSTHGVELANLSRGDETDLLRGGGLQA
jgi:hypothetical protein